MVQLIERKTWSESDEHWKGEVECGQFGAGLCLIFNHQDILGGGPRLHRHPYAETFIIRQGTALFTVGGQQMEVSAGQIVIVPADVPHKFANLGPGPLESIDIHDNGRFETEWLE